MAYVTISFWQENTKQWRIHITLSHDKLYLQSNYFIYLVQVEIYQDILTIFVIYMTREITPEKVNKSI